MALERVCQRKRERARARAREREREKRDAALKMTALSSTEPWMLR
jgi:hypothetical protein